MAVRSRAVVGRGWVVMVWATAAALSCGKSSGGKPNGGGGGGGGGGDGDGDGGPPAAGAGGKPTVAVVPAAGAAASLNVAGASQVGGGGVGGAPAIESDAGAAGLADGPSCDATCQAAVVGQVSDFGTTWQSSWFLMGCTSGGDPTCGVPTHCPNQDAATFDGKGTATLETFPIGGDPGQHYKVTFKFNAIAAAKAFSGGSPDVNAPKPDRTVDGFYRDGQPVPSGYDAWRLGVFDETGVEVRHYFMNSTSSGVSEQHETYRFSYTKSIVVVGGGKVTHRIHDPDCYTMNNCLPGADTCQGGSYLPGEPLGLALPALYQDPFDGQLKPLHELSFLNPAPAEQPWHSQLGHLTVIAVEATTDPVTQDY